MGELAATDFGAVLELSAPDGTPLRRPDTPAGVDNLVLFHHDPYHNDDELEVLLELAKARYSGGRERVCLAQEGMTITLDATNGVLLAP